MKKLLTLLALGASLSFSAAAQPQEPNTLGPGVNAPAYELTPPKGSAWPKELVGTWVGAEDKANGLTAGKLVLSADKTVSLEPEGMFVLKGYWLVTTGGSLVFDTPLQKAESAYKLDDKNKSLVLTYSNGFVQRFTRSTGPQPAPKKK